MSNRFNQYGSATATEIQHDIPSGSFDGLDRGGTTYVTSLINNYQNRQTYYVESNGHGKYSAKWIRSGGYWHGRYGLPAGNYPSSGLVLIGIFDSFTELQSAVDAALGYHYTTYFADYVTDEFDKVWTASYDYVNVWRIDTSTNSHSILVAKPCYLDLLNGYSLDPRIRGKLAKLKPKKTQLLKIGYYRQNSTEPVSGLSSIDWFSYAIEVEKDREIYLPIDGCVLGTLWISDPQIESQIRSMSNKVNEYAVSDYFPDSVPALFSHWQSLYAIEDVKPLPVGAGSLISESETHQVSSTLRILGANHNVWKNGNIVDDVDFDIAHPLFAIDEQRTFDYHFKPQIESDSLGNLVMDSPKIVELWSHFCSQNPVLNDLDNDLPRLNTHGYYLTKISHLLGHRVDANGEVDLKKEAEIIPQLLHKPKWKQGDTSYSQYCFGKKGIVIPSLPTSYDKSGKLLEQYHICHDLPQYLLALQSDIDKSLGIEQGSQIRVKGLDGKIVPFQNQLAMAIDNQQKITILSDRIEKLYGMNLVQGQELRGLYSGIGIPVSVEKLPVTDIKGKVRDYLPYHTHQQSQSSILGHLTAIKMNISIVLGTLMPKAENKTLNPFKRLAGSIKPIKWLK